MGHTNHGHASTLEVTPPDAAKIRKVWATAGILALVTAIEFVFAFTMGKGIVLTSIFVLLTFVKTYYIVAEFMHLKYEVKGLIYSIVGPVLFIVWLIVALLYEGDAVLDTRNWIEVFVK